MSPRQQNSDLGWVLLLAALFILIGICMCLLLLTAAEAHSWYDSSCCSDSDCAPVADGAIREEPNEFIMPNGDTVARTSGRVHQSLDGRWHWCHTQQAGTICVYVPPRGF